MNAPSKSLFLTFLVVLLVAAAPITASGIDGSYKLAKRVLPDGTEIAAGEELVGFGTWADGWRNFNVSWTEGDRRVAISLIAEFELSETEYCETPHHYVASNTSGEGLVLEAPAEKFKCSTVTVKDGHPSFQVPGELPVVTFDDDGMTARAGGLFVDHWEKVD